MDAIAAFPETDVGKAIAVAAFSALVAAVSFVSKLIASWVSAWWQRRAAVIRFFNDVEIWMHGAELMFTAKEFNRLADAIVQGPPDFRFQIPTSGEADTKEIMKCIHWLGPQEIKAVRSFMMQDELLDSISRTLGSDEFAQFGHKRKVNALAEMFCTGEATLAAAKTATRLLSKRRHFLNAGNDTMSAENQHLESETETSAALRYAITVRLDAL